MKHNEIKVTIEATVGSDFQREMFELQVVKYLEIYSDFFKNNHKGNKIKIVISDWVKQ